MLSASDWDFLRVQKAKTGVRHITKNKASTTVKYTAAIKLLMADGKPRSIKDVTITIGSGYNWGRDYLFAHGIKEGKRWTLRGELND